MVGAVLLLLIVTIGMATQSSYVGPLFLVIAYLVAILIVNSLIKARSSFRLRMSQFLLSVFCRAENNRLYLRQGIELRPGFLGKWIEFISLEQTESAEIIKNMRMRFLKPTMEQRSSIFDKQVMS